mmetsp:Transcript_7528/g.10386  ORF Transcript_7528/g.10386 Transcript_7528/m.10386 type:complete len:537 (-) Transcript_7528:56-1666(-)
MIGKKVRVFWPLDEQWYVGEVQRYDHSTGEHLLTYPDGDTEWVKIGENNTNASAGMGTPPGAQPPQAPPQSQGGGASEHHGNEHHMRLHMEQHDNASEDNGAKCSENARSGSPEKRHYSSPEHPSRPSHHSHPPHPHAESSWPGNAHKSNPAPTNPSKGSPSQQQAAPFGGLSPYPHPHHIGYGGMSPSMPPHMHPPHYAQPYPPHGHPQHQSAHYPPHYGYPHPHHNPHVPPQNVNAPNKRSINPMSPESAKPNAPGGPKRKSGPKTWTKEEDNILLSMVRSMRMPMKWSIVAHSMPDRTGKQCRERYVNHLNPRLKITEWSPAEDATIFHLYNTSGSQWAKMSKMIPGRTDNGIKNRFHNLRRQLEREDDHRLRLSKPDDFPDEIRLDRIRPFPENLKGKSDDLWDMRQGIGVIAAQSVLGGGIARNAGRFGPFRPAEPTGEQCARCGLFAPSAQCGTELCSRTRWCLSCTRVPPHVSGNLLRECLNLRKCQEPQQATVITSWGDLRKEDCQEQRDERSHQDGMKDDAASSTEL